MHVGALRTHYNDLPNFIKIGGTVEKIWRLNGFQNGGRLPSWILKFLFFNGQDG